MHLSSLLRSARSSSSYETTKREGTRMYRSEKCSNEPTFPHSRKTPSFSSSLLDAIYRSIDESDGHDAFPCYAPPKAATAAKQSGSLARTSAAAGAPAVQRREKITSLRRAIMLENSNSASSSSDSSSGGIFSSSENEWRPRTRKPEEKASKPETDGRFSRTKLKALRIYKELKKSKQPISPGSRLSSFLNSIFNSNAKKVKICSVGAMEDVSFGERKSKSACSFSRSCLSAKPSGSSREFGATSRAENGGKRSVRFYPVNVIDEGSRPCGHKRVHHDDPRLMRNLIGEGVFKRSSLREELRVQDYVRSYQKKVVVDYGDDGDDGDDEDDDDGDAWSCSSSDLFELDHRRLGVSRYREELPVYETTNLKTNQAIAKGLVF